MSTDSVSYTASYLRGLKAEHEAKVLRDTITGVCKMACEAILESAKQGKTKFQFYMMPQYSNHDLERIRAKLGQSFESPTNVQINNIQTNLATKCNDTFVGLCLTDLEKTFTDCVISGESEVSPRGERYTISVDWSDTAPPATPPPAQEHSVESLLAELSALKAENAALKAQEAKKKDPFDLIELFTGFGAIQNP